ncbi:MAG: periplasmic-type flagellar collar protein FlcA, partial [Spirochaetaceae bacterium]
MPGIEEIRQFNKNVTLMGNEPHIASQRGEPLEDPLEPEQGLSEDLESLLDDTPVDDADTEPDEDDPFAGIDLGDDEDEDPFAAPDEPAPEAEEFDDLEAFDEAPDEPAPEAEEFDDLEAF